MFKVSHIFKLFVKNVGFLAQMEYFLINTIHFGEFCKMKVFRSILHCHGVFEFETRKCQKYHVFELETRKKALSYVSFKYRFLCPDNRPLWRTANKELDNI